MNIFANHGGDGGASPDTSGFGSAAHDPQVWLVSSTSGPTLAWHALGRGGLPRTWRDDLRSAPPAGANWPTIEATAVCGHRDRYHDASDNGLFSGLARCSRCCELASVSQGTGRPH